MRSARDLHHMLDDIDRRGYPAYKSLRGSYDFGDFTLSVDHVQGDPFAAPSHLSVFVGWGRAGWPDEVADEPWRRVALEDFLARRLARACGRWSMKAPGSGKSGLLATCRPGPEVLERSACEVLRDGVLARLDAGFPARGRTVDAGALAQMLFDYLPRIVDEALTCAGARDEAAARAAADLADDQRFIRGELERQGLVAFVADGSVLPRESGVSGRPLRGAVPFVAPEGMAVTLHLPHRGPTRGMAVRRGVTLVVGGGYHGKSTLLQALQEGVYDHVAGDGREYVACDASAVKLRAEDRRAVHGVDISLFIDGLPGGTDTRRFSTADASGSTSQAAAAVEAVEAGARALLMDEDTSATNFMVRDDLMAAVVSADHEPITPFVERVRDLWERAGVSSVIVVGSSGAFFGVADAVVQMDRYRALDVTARVRQVCSERAVAPVRRAPGFALPAQARLLDVRAGGGARASRPRRDDGGADAVSGATRAPGGRGRGRAGGERLKVRSSRDSVQVADGSADLRLVEQLVDPAQCAALAQMVRCALGAGMLDGDHTVAEVVAAAFDDIRAHGFEALGEHGDPSCGLALPRPQELAACLNRWRA